MNDDTRDEALLALGRLVGLCEGLAMRAITDHEEGSGMMEAIEDQVSTIRAALAAHPTPAPSNGD